jgi:hypothetical protein
MGEQTGFNQGEIAIAENPFLIERDSFLPVAGHQEEFILDKTPGFEIGSIHAAQAGKPPC